MRWEGRNHRVREQRVGGKGGTNAIFFMRGLATRRLSESGPADCAMAD